MGFSTRIAAQMFVDTINTPNTQSIIIAQDEENSKRIFQMIKRFYDLLPISHKRIAKSESTTSLWWDDIDSYFFVGWAGSRKIGRGGTINNVHACLHEDAKVILSDGSTKTIKEIEIGDKVITSSGQVAPITHKFHPGLKDCWELKTWLSNESLIMSGEHKVLTDNGYKPCQSLTSDDWVAQPKIELTNEIKTYEFTFEKHHKSGIIIEKESIPLNYEFGYYLGYYLAEGHVTKQHNSSRFSSVNFCYHRSETFIDRIKLFAEYYCKSIKDTEFENKNVTVVYGTFLAHLTNEICGRVETKNIPDWFFKTNKEFIHGVVKGYLDGDGSKETSNRISAVCIREKITRQLKRLIIGLGYGVPGVQFKNERYRYDKKTRDILILELNGDTYLNFINEENSREKSPATKYKFEKGIFYVKVKSNISCGNHNVIDITVDHEDHNFETTIGIVSNSEVAFWENAGDLVSGLFNSVPDNGNIFLESTANGVDNYYYREYTDAAKNESVYNARFYPWFLDDEYEADNLILGGEFVADEEEEQLRELYRLTDRKLIWRRNKILQLKNAFLSGDDTARSFQQEYPSNAKEAFLTTGVSFFDKKFIINTLYPKVSPPLGSEAPNKFANLARVRYQQAGRLSWWKKPEVGHRYIITADPSEGLNLNNELDFCSTSVVDVETWEQVCHLHGRWEPTEYANLIYELAVWYEYGLIVVARMNHGHSVLNTLINHICYEGRDGWGGVYYHVSYDAKSKQKTKKPGFPENKQTKIIMLSSLHEVTHDESLTINCEQTLDEMMMYTKLPGGNYGASVGHDDRVTDIGLAAVVIKDAAFQKRQAKKERRKRLGTVTEKKSRKEGIML